MIKVSLAAVLATAAAALATPALAQDVGLPGLPDIDASREAPTAHNGAGVFHGNYCGVGDRGAGLPPTDALDEACMHHDACTPAGGVPSCGCNLQFRQEVHAVAADDDEEDELRSLADAVEAAIPLIPCRR